VIESVRKREIHLQNPLKIQSVIIGRSESTTSLTCLVFGVKLSLPDLLDSCFCSEDEAQVSRASNLL